MSSEELSFLVGIKLRQPLFILLYPYSPGTSLEFGPACPCGGRCATPVTAHDANRYTEVLLQVLGKVVAHSGEVAEVFWRAAAPHTEQAVVVFVFLPRVRDLGNVKK